MDRLQKDLRSMIHVVEENLRKNVPTTKPNLTGFVNGISVSLERDSSSLPTRISEICSSCLLDMLGWDSKKHASVNDSLFTPQNLLLSLVEILRQVGNWSPVVNPTVEELDNLSYACSKLWELDSNRLVPDHDYRIDLQNGKAVFQDGDAASNPLFSSVDAHVFEKPTYKAFVALLDNYVAETGRAEIVTKDELKEDNNFLQLIMDTAVMQYVHRYLLAKGKTHSVDRASFIRELDRIWFGLYGRKTANDSSGFEHVFLGEVNPGGEVVGMHNWIQIYLEERKGALNYRGFIRPKRGGTRPSNLEQLVSFQFEWRGGVKPVSSSFIGTSPEFEIALYTLCFFAGEEKITVNIRSPYHDYRVLVTSYKWNVGKNVYIASTFPSDAPLDAHEVESRGAGAGAGGGGGGAKSGGAKAGGGGAHR